MIAEPARGCAEASRSTFEPAAADLRLSRGPARNTFSFPFSPVRLLFWHLYCWFSGVFENHTERMEKPLRILHLEDDPDFVSLVSDMLREEGLPAEMTSTQNFQSFISALNENRFDLILADYSLPTCNGLQALHAVREKDPNTPFVLISGTIGEHAAIECLRCGATDYVLKNKLERLAPTVRRAVKEAEERSHRKRADYYL